MNLSLFHLGNQTLRDFVFNETPSGSFINTIHESCLAQLDESMNRSCVNNDDIVYDDGYNHEELVHAAIEDLNDIPSHTNDVFKSALNELNNQDPSSIHSNSGNFQSQQSTNVSHNRIVLLAERERKFDGKRRNFFRIKAFGKKY